MISRLSLLSLFAFVSFVSCNGGHSTTYRKQDDAGNYAFGYHIKDPWGASNFRKESGDGWGNKHGSYGIKDIDGRERIVSYIADKEGFRAKIHTNEPGTGNIDAADAIYNGADPYGHSHTHIVSGHHGHHGHHGWNKHHGGHYEHHGNHYGKHHEDKGWEEPHGNVGYIHDGYAFDY